MVDVTPSSGFCGHWEQAHVVPVHTPRQSIHTHKNEVILKKKIEVTKAYWLDHLRASDDIYTIGVFSRQILCLRQRKITMQYSCYEPFCTVSPLSYWAFMCQFKVNVKMIEKYQIVRHYLATTKNLSFQSALNRSFGEIPNTWKGTTSHP